LAGLFFPCQIPAAKKRPKMKNQISYNTIKKNRTLTNFLETEKEEKNDAD